MATVEERLRELGLTLPDAPGPPPGSRITLRMARRSGSLSTSRCETSTS